MPKEKSQCPDCKIALKPLLLSDIVGDDIENERVPLVHAAKALFSYFTLRVCTQCGRTAMYVSREARKRAMK